MRGANPRGFLGVGGFSDIECKSVRHEREYEKPAGRSFQLVTHALGIHCVVLVRPADVIVHLAKSGTTLGQVNQVVMGCRNPLGAGT